MHIPVEIEVGSIVKGISDIYVLKKEYTRDYVKGMVKSIDPTHQTIKIFGYKSSVPFYRIHTFTFGGIEIVNKYYNKDKIEKVDNKKIHK